MGDYSCRIHGYFSSTVIKGDVPCPWCERDALSTEVRRAYDAGFNDGIPAAALGLDGRSAFLEAGWRRYSVSGTTNPGEDDG